jgi:hypothetical protein
MRWDFEGHAPSLPSLVSRLWDGVATERMALDDTGHLWGCYSSATDAAASKRGLATNSGRAQTPRRSVPRMSIEEGHDVRCVVAPRTLAVSARGEPRDLVRRRPHDRSPSDSR